MSNPSPGYHFGDLTRGLIHWLGPHALAVPGRIDWLKFGKALVVAFLTGQTVGWGVLVASLAGAVSDPQLAAAIPAIATVLAGAIELVRRVAQGHPNPPDPARSSHAP
jgi:hypothetical protein